MGLWILLLVMFGSGVVDEFVCVWLCVLVKFLGLVWVVRNLVGVIGVFSMEGWCICVVWGLVIVCFFFELKCGLVGLVGLVRCYVSSGLWMN